LSASGFFADFDLAFDCDLRSSTSLSQFFGPDFEEVGYAGAVEFVFVVVDVPVAVFGEVDADVAVGATVDSRVDHFRPGSDFTSVNSTFVERTLNVLVVGLMGWHNGSRSNVKSEPEGRGNVTDS